MKSCSAEEFPVEELLCGVVTRQKGRVYSAGRLLSNAHSHMKHRVLKSKKLSALYR